MSQNSLGCSLACAPVTSWPEKINLARSSISGGALSQPRAGNNRRRPWGFFLLLMFLLWEAEPRLWRWGAQARWDWRWNHPPPRSVQKIKVVEPRTDHKVLGSQEPLPKEERKPPHGPENRAAARYPWRMMLKTVPHHQKKALEFHSLQNSGKNLVRYTRLWEAYLWWWAKEGCPNGCRPSRPRQGRSELACSLGPREEVPLLGHPGQSNWGQVHGGLSAEHAKAMAELVSTSGVAALKEGEPICSGVPQAKEAVILEAASAVWGKLTSPTSRQPDHDQDSPSLFPTGSSPQWSSYLLQRRQ